MNIDAICLKYWSALTAVEAVMTPQDTAIALALRLAIQETADANVALVNDMSGIIANLRADASDDEDLASCRAERDAYRSRARKVDAECHSLRQQLAQMDADNADLTRRLATANAFIDSAEKEMQP